MQIKLLVDDDPMNPREWCTFGTMVCFHKKYTLGDKHKLTAGMFDGWEAMERYLEKELGAYIVLPLFLYDHGSLTIRCETFADPWDSGQVGFIYITAEKIREEFKVKRISPKLFSRVVNMLKSEVATYDAYLRGDVWGYEITDDYGQHKDSCFGFYSRQEAMDAAQEAIRVWRD